MSLHRKARNTGQSHSEYVLIGMLILVFTVPAMLLMSQNLRESLGEIIPEWRSSTVSEASLAMRDNKTPPSLEQTMDVTLQGPADSSFSARDLAILQENLAAKVQTLGANGTTTLLSNQLAVLAKQLLEAGKIDQTQYAAILDLSNQGHRMAMIEGKLEAAMLQAQGDPRKLKTMTIPVDGKSYSTMDLSATLGYTQVGPGSLSSTDLLRPDVQTSPELSRFLALYRQVNQLDVMQDPAVKATIDSAAHQIAGLGETVEHAVYLQEGGDQAAIRSEKDLRQSLGQIATDFESARICTAGDFKDNGVLCSQ